MFGGNDSNYYKAMFPVERSRNHGVGSVLRGAA